MPRATVGALELEWEAIGDPSDPAVVLIAGLGAQLVQWPEAFCRTIAVHGRWVVRFDNRDAGRSDRVEGGPEPDVAAALTGDTRTSSYRLEAMAQDVAGLLDALGLATATVVGASVGGAIAQLVAARHPERVTALVSMMSSIGGIATWNSSADVRARQLRPSATTPQAEIEAAVEGALLAGSPAYPTPVDELRRRALRIRERGRGLAEDGRGAARQLLALEAAGDRTRALHSIRAPTTVVHGLADPVISWRSGLAVARAIPGASLVVLPGMGHDLPAALHGRLAHIVTAGGGLGSSAKRRG